MLWRNNMEMIMSMSNNNEPSLGSLSMSKPESVTTLRQPTDEQMQWCRDALHALLKCEECLMNYADRPSRLCPGCQAYREHQQ